MYKKQQIQATDAANCGYGVRELRKQISRKAYERREIANAELAEKGEVPFNLFKDPYLLDALGLKDNFLEADLEKAILVEMEKLILESGHGFSFVERQKRMTMEVLETSCFVHAVTRSYGQKDENRPLLLPVPI